VLISTRIFHQELEQYTRGFSIVVDGPPEASKNAADYQWTYDPSYPVDRISGGDWCEWMHDEIEMWREEGHPDRYDDMFDRPIEEPIIITEIDGVAYLWDGCHRTAASVTRGLATIPAVVGRLRLK
jgi:hypothetical protein